MNDFRIVQTQALTQVLPYEVQEYCRVWYLPWPVWRTLNDFSAFGTLQWPVAMRFQTPREARLCIEKLLITQTRQCAEEAHRKKERSQQQQLSQETKILKLLITG